MREIRSRFASLQSYQLAVDGWIDAVDIPGLGITIYVNEEGLLRHLPFNSRASFLWWYHVPQARQAMLVGNAVVVGSPDHDGEITDVPDEVINLLTSAGEYAVPVKLGGEPTWYTDPDSKLSAVVLPLISGEPTWFRSSARYADYFEAAAWAMVMMERLEAAEEGRVALVSELPHHLPRTTGTATSTKGQQWRQSPGIENLRVLSRVDCRHYQFAWC